MVRPPAACAHPSLHHQAAALGDRARRRARLPALPVRLAACAEETRLEGPDALPAVLAPLEGFEAPARAWETEILPARLKDYEASWLDAQCLAGRTAWARLTPHRLRGRRSAPCNAGRRDADRARRAAPGAALDVACASARTRPDQAPRAQVRARMPRSAGRAVLRRAGGSRASACARRSKRRCASSWRSGS